MVSQATKYNQRRRILERDGYCCQYCGDAVSDQNATIDHVIPVSLGGSESIDNKRTSCKRCNQQKSDRSEQWLRLFMAFGRTKYASVITLEQYHRLLGLGVILEPLPEVIFHYESPARSAAR